MQIDTGTLTERYKQGTRLRKKTPREKHAELRGPADRDAVAILAQTDRTRVPELVPERYKRMLASPFTFLRGAAAVMAEDLRHQPSAGIAVQSCGDCHLMNFGAFATPDRTSCSTSMISTRPCRAWISPSISSGSPRALQSPHWRRTLQKSGAGDRLAPVAAYRGRVRACQAFAA